MTGRRDDVVDQRKIAQNQQDTETKLEIRRSESFFESEYGPNASEPADSISIEVFSWGAAALWIADKLAGGVLGAIGANIWSEVDGRMSIEDLYRAATADSERHLSVAFAQHEINEATDACKRAKIALEDYRAAPRNRLDTLAQAEAWSRTVLSTFMSERHTVAGFPSFLIAGGLHLAILQERLNQFRDPAEIEVIKSNVRRLCRHIADASSATRSYVADGFKGFHIQSYGGISMPRGGSSPTHFQSRWWYQRDFFYGPIVRVEGLDQEAAEREARNLGIRAFNAHKTRELKIIEDTTIKDATAVELKWQLTADEARVPT